MSISASSSSIVTPVINYVTNPEISPFVILEEMDFERFFKMIPFTEFAALSYYRLQLEAWQSSQDYEAIIINDRHVKFISLAPICLVCGNNASRDGCKSGFHSIEWKNEDDKIYLSGENCGYKDVSELVFKITDKGVLIEVAMDLGKKTNAYFSGKFRKTGEVMKTEINDATIVLNNLMKSFGSGKGLHISTIAANSYTSKSKKPVRTQISMRNKGSQLNKIPIYSVPTPITEAKSKDILKKNLGHEFICSLSQSLNSNFQIASPEIPLVMQFNPRDNYTFDDFIKWVRDSDFHIADDNQNLKEKREFFEKQSRVMRYVDKIIYIKISTSPFIIQTQLRKKLGTFRVFYDTKYHRKNLREYLEMNLEIISNSSEWRPYHLDEFSQLDPKIFNLFPGLEVELAISSQTIHIQPILDFIYEVYAGKNEAFFRWILTYLTQPLRDFINPKICLCLVGSNIEYGSSFFDWERSYIYGDLVYRKYDDMAQILVGNFNETLRVHINHFDLMPNQGLALGIPKEAWINFENIIQAQSYTTFTAMGNIVENFTDKITFLEKDNTLIALFECHPSSNPIDLPCDKIIFQAWYSFARSDYFTKNFFVDLKDVPISSIRSGLNQVRIKNNEEFLEDLSIFTHKIQNLEDGKNFISFKNFDECYEEWLKNNKVSEAWKIHKLHREVKKKGWISHSLKEKDRLDVKGMLIPFPLI